MLLTWQGPASFCDALRAPSSPNQSLSRSSLPALPATWLKKTARFKNKCSSPLLGILAGKWWQIIAPQRRPSVPHSLSAGHWARALPAVPTATGMWSGISSCQRQPDGEHGMATRHRFPFRTQSASNSLPDYSRMSLMILISIANIYIAPNRCQALG